MKLAEVFREVYAVHPEYGATPRASFYALARKNIMIREGYIPTQHFKRLGMEVHEEWIKTADLRDLVNRPDNKRAWVRRPLEWRNKPVVVAVYEGREHLVDGNRRVICRHHLGEEMTKAYVVELIGAEAIRDRYTGKRALNYEARRAASLWWKAENEAVKSMLTGLSPGSTVLDVPVGTARYASIYRELGLKVLGIDISSDMLKLAMRNIKAVHYAANFELSKGDVLRLGHIGTYDAVVCTRLLNWLTHDEMSRAMALMMRACKKRLIVSIELGKPKGGKKKLNRPHPREHFNGVLHAIGGVIKRTVPISGQYAVVQIGRRDATD